MSQALAAPDEKSASNLWHQADMEAMSQAALFPISDPNAGTVQGTQVHNCIYIGAIQNCNMANIWLTK
jgi:peptide/nickel transport system substrate-binding protein